MNIYEEFFNNFNFDIKAHGSARWIDQKCSADVICIIADCIVNYINNDKDKEFTVSDIWKSKYAEINVQEIFSKPNVNKKSAKNEFDKYFSQPILLLAHSKVLKDRKEGFKHNFSVNNLEILKKIAMRVTNAIDFLFIYITKVLKDSNLYPIFENFFNKQWSEPQRLDNK